MSQVSNKVDWCLRKAEKEMEERGIHRGLVKNHMRQDLAEKHIAKADHNLKAAIYFDQGGYSDWSASAFFYCMYHCFLAILRKFGYESRNQECTIAVIEMLKEEGSIEFDEVFVSSLKATRLQGDAHEENITELREKLQYGVDMEFVERKRFEELVVACKKVIEATKNIVYNKTIK